MKNKRLLIILVVFSILVLFVVLGSTVFTVSKIEVKWKTTSDYLSSLTDEEVLNDIDIETGQSVFLLNKQSYIDKLEQAVPYIKVYAIETVFPNKLVVYVGERVPVYALKVSDSANVGSFLYVVLDEELKVLGIRTIINPNSNSEPVLLEIGSANFTDLNFSVGNSAKNVIDNKLFYDFCYAVKMYDLHPVNIFKNMTVEFGYNTTITLQPLDNEEITGVTFVIKDAKVRLQDKVEKVLSIIEYLKANDIGDVTVEVRVNAQNQIEGVII